jgi:hypothetical protein
MVRSLDLFHWPAPNHNAGKDRHLARKVRETIRQALSGFFAMPDPEQSSPAVIFDQPQAHPIREPEALYTRTSKRGDRQPKNKINIENRAGRFA